MVCRRVEVQVDRRDYTNRTNPEYRPDKILDFLEYQNLQDSSLCYTSQHHLLPQYFFSTLSASADAAVTRCSRLRDVRSANWLLSRTIYTLLLSLEDITEFLVLNISEV